ncbi:MAG: bifunctional methylenetetrahydrofolate dehydrogenase/methenyltetrahydrofolate cyclohydrolase FolD [Synechococcus sp. BS301-5m-G54]|jgi:methylenetetrahydrofolate dehydrogenase (NADP+)/methenyltetrahydrofolate cyclohydrolase|uniref:bifunctional methylenetetrahydrofolate dehydrogenase/methenyltetrahydrofolate cyclohydrolase FolD n=1 Tax=Synechococcus sp. KORDI-49 TaxID=585423 RepID=UPI0004E04064|nr:bifunctional methylenetetrahydrofolate dehydrogenase/methenyltetrahydrofolate cyclohydrolase FolD [Synechococcus sp. KORDI-49]MBL6738989.1 bifunctional methylenetetrahydrofolate dehydrogenase/methenyltetrahydrofolate cyclohydrolase FolD [Synechococcus sp. BS301-5m-G54]MBL6795091.1 bifunctional methylenetetrahydrofolate dehydrogenase/methenyltetrahydrofolate cyclohydrolase FolD [Synechococcus sp. BS307-5m-G34]RCL54516.1 MAG: bifunctional methylenetetrahydrofolate dehydrogenase/methenyltetrahyd
MALRLDGKVLAKAVEHRLSAVIKEHQSGIGRPPGLAVLRVGDDPASAVYVANKEKACARIGVASFGAHLAAETAADAVLGSIRALNADPRVDGILLQLPLPDGLDERPLLEAIDPEKDADGLHTLNLGRLLKGESGPRSCTPAGVMAMLRSNGIDPAGKRAVVIGRSILVGQPMALMLQAANATVTVAHSRTVDLAAHTREADILVVAAGRPGMVGAEHVRAGAAVVDVGIHRRPEGGLCGDVVAAEVEPIAAALSPVPGGVGPMTVTMLLVNTVVAWCRRHGIDHGLDDLIV